MSLWFIKVQVLHLLSVYVYLNALSGHFIRKPVTGKVDVQRSGDIVPEILPIRWIKPLVIPLLIFAEHPLTKLEL